MLLLLKESVLPDDMQHNEHVKIISTTATGKEEVHILLGENLERSMGFASSL